MKLIKAKNLRNGDRVAVKKGKEIMEITDIEHVSREETCDGSELISVRLSNGNWYGYKEVCAVE